MTLQQRQLRIGIDAACWTLRRGFGRHTRCLLGALLQIDQHNNYTFFADADAAAELPSRCTVRLIKSRTAWSVSNSGSRPIGNILRMSWAMSREALDVILFPAIYSFVPVFTSAKIVLMLHDTTAETLPKEALHNLTARMLWNAKVRLGRWQADSLAAVSEFARDQLCSYFGIPADHIKVVGEAPDAMFRPLPGNATRTAALEKYGFKSGRRMIVHLGGFSPHKNLTYLLREYAELVRDDAYNDVYLVLVGDYQDDKFHSCYLETRAQVEKSPSLAGRVIFSGYVPDTELVDILNGASALAMASLNEGFGLPAVEAAACGCPVIATTASPIPSILGDGALYIDPRAPGALRARLEEVLGSTVTRDALRQKGLAAAARLDWKLEACKLLRIIETVANR